MDLETRIVQAIRGEVDRQASNSAELVVREGPPATIIIEGSVNLDELAMVIVGTLAGGP